MIEPPLRLRRAIHANDVLLVSRILKTHPSLLQNPDYSPVGLSNTSLHLACSLGHIEIVKLLLGLGHEGIPLPSVGSRSRAGSRVLGSKGPSPIPSPGTGLFRRGGVKRESRSRDSLINPPFTENQNRNLKTDPYNNEKRLDISLNEHHQTPLHLACLAGHTEIVHLLCTLVPSYIPRRDYRGRDAVMNASEFGHDTIVQIILTAVQAGEVARWGAGDTNEKGGFGEKGPGKGDILTLEEVLANSDVDGNTALHFASMNGHLLVLRTLLAAGAESERRNVWSWTAGNYSATVQAEVYFKELVAEVERRKQVRKLAEETQAHLQSQTQGKGREGSTVRLVMEEEEGNV